MVYCFDNKDNKTKIILILKNLIVVVQILVLMGLAKR